jgi:phosphate transport system substrate-binding protein
MSIHPEVSIYVQGGGTASGFDALIRGKADICSASRPIKSEEASLLAQNFRSVGIYSVIAKDALSIYVNTQNPVKNFSLKQLKQLFSGEITNWQEIGGINDSVHIILRPPNSGTYLYFREHILEDRSYISGSQTEPTNQAVVNAVKENVSAIGYGGFTAGPDEMRASVNGIHPSIDNVRYDLYPISRYLYLYTIKKPGGETKKFIDWVVSKEGQTLVQTHGFISLWPTSE